MTSVVAKLIHETVPATPRTGTTERLLGSFRAVSARASARIGAAYATGRAYEEARDRATRQSVLDRYGAELHRYRL
jgi:hypothetical protein